MSLDASLFDCVDGVAHYRGLRVETHTVSLQTGPVQIALLRDAAELLDHPEYAKPFLEADIAPYGLELWPVAIMLARHILDSEPGEGRAALDLGCGLGLTAIAATLRGWQVTAADHEPTSLRFAAFNAQANNVAVHRFTHFDWHQPPRDQRVDRVFAADVLYQRTDHVPILKCLEVMLTGDGVAKIADPCRQVADRFADLAGENGWRVEQMAGSAPNFFGPSPITGRIFALRRE